MNTDELSSWRDGVNEHISMVDTLVNDRKILKNLIEEHLKQFFDWDSIEYNKDFSEITMKWDKDCHPIIKHEKINELMMDWCISVGYDDNAFRIVVIEVYPFGLEEDSS